MVAWMEEAAERVRRTHSDARTAFAAFYGRSVRERLAGLKDILPSLNMDDTTLSRKLYLSYSRGMADASLAYRVDKGLELAASARLALEITEPTKFAYALGHARVPAVYLTAQQVRRGLEDAGVVCGMSMARWLIQRWDSSRFLDRDGRLSLQDFERFYHSGVDHYVKNLERLAKEITAEEREAGSWMPAPPGSRQGSRQRSPEARDYSRHESMGRPGSVGSTGSAAGPSGLIVRRWSQKRHQKAVAAQQARLREESASIRQEFDSELLVGRLREHHRFCETVTTAVQKKEGDRAAAGSDGRFALDMSVSEIGQLAPRVLVHLRDALLPPLGPLASLLALEQCRGRPTSLSDFRWAMLEAGMDLTATEVLQLADEYGGATPGGVSDHAPLSACGYFMDWRGCFTDALEKEEEDIEAMAAQELGWACNGVRAWARQVTGHYRPSLADRCRALLQHPFPVSWGSRQITRLVRGHAHPVLQATALLRMAAPGDDVRLELLRTLRSLDRAGRGTLALADVSYAVSTLASAKAGTQLPKEGRESLLATFQGPTVRGLAAKVLAEDRQCDYRALVMALSPLRAEVEADKGRCGCLAWGDAAVDAADPVAAVVRLSSVIFRPYLEFARLTENAAGRDGFVAAADVASAAAAALGVALSQGEVEWIEVHFGTDPETHGLGQRISPKRIVAAVAAVVDDLASRQVRMRLAVVRGRVSVSLFLTSHDY